MWLITSQKNGWGSYISQTAWTYLHKLRRAMIGPAKLFFRNAQQAVTV